MEAAVHDFEPAGLLGPSQGRTTSLVKVMVGCVLVRNGMTTVIGCISVQEWAARSNRQDICPGFMCCNCIQCNRDLLSVAIKKL